MSNQPPAHNSNDPAAFAHALKSPPPSVPTARTLNNMPAYASTLSATLDLFYHLVRTISAESLRALLAPAWAESPLATLRVMFNSRDCRADSLGKGDRAPFRHFLAWLSETRPDTAPAIIAKNIPAMLELGYWKDVLHLISTMHPSPVSDAALSFVASQLTADLAALAANKPVSLLGKYLPGESKSNARTQALIRAKMNWDNKQYRRAKSQLGAAAHVVEQKMSANEWSEIAYAGVPSIAMARYKKAFKKHDEARFDAFLEEVAAGKTKINAAQVYPHELVRGYVMGGPQQQQGDEKNDEVDKVAEEQWKAIAKEATKLSGTLVMSDVSGSMTCDKAVPMCVSVALGLLTAEVAQPPWDNLVLTFSAEPELHAVLPAGKHSLKERVAQIMKANWGGNTDLQKALELVLARARGFGATKEQMPERVLVISDMQFDQAVGSRSGLDAMVLVRKRFAEEGYDVPQIVFWNVSRLSKGSVPVQAHESGALLLSGYSPHMMKALVGEGHIDTPLDFLMKVLEHPRYANISV